MKVLQILPELNAGGVERGTLEMARHLVRCGHESRVVSHGGQLVAELESAGTTHITLPVHRKSLSSVFQVRQLRNILERERPDILHIRSRVPGWIAWLAWRKMPLHTRPRLVSTVHGFYSVNAYSAVMTLGERVIAVSECVRDYIIQNYPKTSPDAICLIHRGIDPDQYSPGARPDAAWLRELNRDFPQLEGKRLLTLPGRVTRLKGHEDFLELLAALRRTQPNLCGVIAGGAHPKKQAYLTEMKSLASRLGIEEHVAFLGHRPDLKEVLAVSDVVFSLSTKPEAFGRTTLEALALGRPVIGYRHGGVGELLQKFLPSGLVDVGSFQDLQESTIRMLHHPETAKTPTGEYTLNAMCDQTVAVYQQLQQLGSSSGRVGKSKRFRVTSEAYGRQ